MSAWSSSGASRWRSRKAALNHAVNSAMPCSLSVLNCSACWSYCWTASQKSPVSTVWVGAVAGGAVVGAAVEGGWVGGAVAGGWVDGVVWGGVVPGTSVVSWPPVVVAGRLNTPPVWMLTRMNTSMITVVSWTTTTFVGTKVGQRFPV